MMSQTCPQTPDGRTDVYVILYSVQCIGTVNNAHCIGQTTEGQTMTSDCRLTLCTSCHLANIWKTFSCNECHVDLITSATPKTFEPLVLRLLYNTGFYFFIICYTFSTNCKVMVMLYKDTRQMARSSLWLCELEKRYFIYLHILCK